MTFSSGPRSESSVEVLAGNDELDRRIDVDGVEPAKQRQTGDGAERKSAMIKGAESGVRKATSVNMEGVRHQCEWVL